MSTHCPQDGGFIGAAGCTHPRHAHSPLVKRILNAKTPTHITDAEARRALKEGFYVDLPNGERVGFGKTLLNHLDAHHHTDADARLKHLEYAIDTIRHPDGVEKKHRLIQGRTAYAKAYKNFGMLVLADTETGLVKQAFTFFPNRKGRQK